jgi:hypothetical protein
MPVGTLNVALSNYAKEFRNNALVSELVAPRVPVDRQSFQYVVWNRDDQRVPASTLRAPGDRPGTVRRSYSVAPFMCRSHALSGSVPYETEAYGMGLGFSTKQALAKQLIAQINLDREVTVANTILNLTNFPNGVTLSGSSMWDPGAGGHPITAVEGFKAELRQAGIQDSDMILILSDPVATALLTHPDVIDRLKYWNIQAGITVDMLSRCFNVKCVRASAITLSTTNVASFVWGVNAVLAYAQDAPTQDDISCMKTFTWVNAPDSTEGYSTIEFPDPYLDSKKWWESVDWQYDIRATAVETAIPILNCCQAPTMVSIPADQEG